MFHAECIKFTWEMCLFTVLWDFMGRLRCFIMTACQYIVKDTAYNPSLRITSGDVSLCSSDFLLGYESFCCSTRVGPGFLSGALLTLFEDVWQFVIP